MAITQIPVIDLAASDESGRSTAPSEILRACQEVGFFYITNHGVPQSVITDARRAAEAFFAMPDAHKDAFEAIDHRGYIGMGDAKMEGASHPDVKESFVAAREPSTDDAGKPLRGRNRWPDRPEEFRPAVEAYMEAVGGAARRVLSHVAVSLGAPADFFEERFDAPLMRTNIIHYPPHEAPADTDEFGVAAHTDFGCITLLWQDDVGGLEVLDRDTDDWVRATPVDGTFVVNVGDLLERWSNGRFASTLHRVVNRSGRERYSLATFFDPTYEAVADPLDLQPDAEAAFEPVVSGDYILGRIQRAFAYRA